MDTDGEGSSSRGGTVVRARFRKRDRCPSTIPTPGHGCTAWLSGIATHAIREHRRAEQRHHRAPASAEAQVATEPFDERSAARIAVPADDEGATTCPGPNPYLPAGWSYVGGGYPWLATLPTDPDRLIGYGRRADPGQPQPDDLASLGRSRPPGLPSSTCASSTRRRHSPHRGRVPRRRRRF